MATIRQIRGSLLLFTWFLFSAVRAWPSRTTSPTNSSSTVREAMLLRFPSRRPIRYGLELSLRPARARLIRVSFMKVTPSIMPGAFVSRIPSTQNGTQSPNFIRTTSSRTKGTTQCTTAPPPVPPPTTTVAGSTAPPSPSCSRTVVEKVCAGPAGQPKHCNVSDCCTMNGVRVHCNFVSSYTTGPYSTYTTFTTASTCQLNHTCYY